VPTVAATYESPDIPHQFTHGATLVITRYLGMEIQPDRLNLIVIRAIGREKMQDYTLGKAAQSDLGHLTVVDAVIVVTDHLKTGQ